MRNAYATIFLIFWTFYRINNEWWPTPRISMPKSPTWNRKDSRSPVHMLESVQPPIIIAQCGMFWMRNMTPEINESVSLIAGDQQLTASTITQSARKAAQGFKDLGLAGGDVVALLLRNDAAFVIASDAARYCDVGIVPLNWHLTAKEIAYILDDCKAKAVIAHTDLLTEEVRKILGERTLLVVATPQEIQQAYEIESALCTSRPEDIDWSSWLDIQAPITTEPKLFAAPLFYTSGTTGHPKAVKRDDLPDDITMKIGQRTMHAWGFGDTPIRSVMAGPLYHSAPNGYGMHIIRSGGLLVLQPKFDPVGLLKLIQEHKITHLHMVPTMFSRLLQLPDSVKASYDLSSLEHVSHGAAPCPPEVKRAMIEWWGPCIYEYYAMTETGIIACSTSQEWLDHQGSVGHPAPGVTIQIRDDDGKQQKDGIPGNICVQHEATGHVSYHNAPDKSAELVQDGFLVTGDIGYMDGDGFFIYI